VKLKIESMDRHRNGVSGVAFYAVLFNDLDEKRKMVASVFTGAESAANPHCAVYDVALLAEGNINFGENSWRGDRYMWALLPLMKDFWAKDHDYGLFE
jgi:hypothetical protein